MTTNTTTSNTNTNIPSTINDSRWNWDNFCGPDGLQLWSPKLHDLGLCFQQLCLQIPVLAFLAIASAYYVGYQVNKVRRSDRHRCAIMFRFYVVTLLALVPIFQIFRRLDLGAYIYPVSYMLSGVHLLSWLTHLGYILVLKDHLTLSARGPIFLGVLWSILLVNSVISLRSYVIVLKNSESPDGLTIGNVVYSAGYLILHVFYGLSLIPSEGSSVFVTDEDPRRNEESQGLLSSAFSRFSEERDPNYLGVAMEGSSWLSRLLFYWVGPLMRKGADGKLNDSDDLYDLPDSLNCTVLSSKLERALCDEREVNEELESIPPVAAEVRFSDDQPKNTLLKALHKCFWLPFYSVGILKFVGDCSGFAGPMLLNKLVSYIENRSEANYLGYSYAFGLFSTTLISAFCNSHFNFKMMIVGLKMRASLVTAIYKKTLSVSGTKLSAEFSFGEIVNFMSTDTDRIVNSCPSFHSLWSIPFQLGVTLYLLHTQVGLAFLAGVAFTIVLIPINKLIANKIGSLSTKMMEQKDNRVKIMTEVLRGIQSIKLHVWEGYFIRLITRIREYELKHLKGRKYLDALCVYFWATTPVLISVLTFTTYVLMGNELTAARVFTTIALLNMLIAPLNAFPWVLNGLTEAWVSVQRIQKLLDLPDLNMEKFYDGNVAESYELIIKDAEFKWDKELTAEEKKQLHLTRDVRRKSKGKGKKRVPDEEVIVNTPTDFQLYGVNLTIKKGELVGVIGRVGSGKSSLLNAIMAELTKQSGNIAVADLENGFGYVPQQAWLQRDTIRDNILFGQRYDETRYISVIHACGLAEDLAELPNGDLTGVGEAGVTMSGGQKARISLARAVYQDKPIYLLDDIFSAVDKNVANHIFQHCVHNLLRKKTVILCTHHIKYLTKADRILVMENGRIIRHGSPMDILSDDDEMTAIDLELAGDSFQSSISILDSIKSDIHESTDKDSLLNEETREVGTVKGKIYASYWKAIGHLLSIAIFLSIILMQSSRNMSDWWLSYWVTTASTNNTNTTDELYYKAGLPSFKVEQYLIIYSCLGLTNSVFTLFRAFLFAYGGIQAAGKLHKQLLKVIIKSKLTFFNITPLGRILNRFSSDTYTIDDSLPFILNILLAQFFGLLGAVIITLYGLPWLSLILVPLIPIYSWLQNHYRLTSRELKRLSSVTLSPVYNHFNESLKGLTTIRALRRTKRFIRHNEENVEINQKAQFASQAAAQWLGLRLQFIGVAMVTGVGTLAVIQHQFDVADPGLVGLAISYALSVTGLLSGVVNAFTETEREMIAVERVDQYIQEIEPEKAAFVMDPPYAWPSQGVVCFSNVSMRYRDHLIPVLRHISFETRPAEKIGIVGRTGAGKSSLISALFRLVEIHEGSITIDSVNVSHISLDCLRSRLSCIPQDPFLFSGTIRENLDPLEEFRDSEIWSVLSKVDLTSTVKRLGGLARMITDGGHNLSAGQRQLFCLARAMLHNAKVLCIDEATANINQSTDRQIQQTLRYVFRKSTVITIAHRIETVMDCDRIIVMSEGNIVDFGTPEELLDDPNSHFSLLVNSDRNVTL